MSVKTSVTLYNLSREVYWNEMSVLDTIDEVGRLGADGVEIVAFQHLFNHPKSSPDDLKAFKARLDKNELDAACYGSYVDTAKKTNGFLSEIEKKELLKLDIDIASSLGFKVIRLNWNTSLPILIELLPYAEKKNVKLSLEMHAPLTVNHPFAEVYIKAMKEADTPFFGICPDFSAWARCLPGRFAEMLKAMAVPGPALKLMNDSLMKGGSLIEIKQDAHDLGMPKELDQLVDLVYHIVCYQPVETLNEIMPLVNHFHAKFWGADSKGGMPAIPFAELLSLINKSSYDGFITSEYEGYMFDEKSRGVESTQKELEIINKYLGKEGV